tara:strand:+ start:358 stop:498 length:141 start_codon:yes stop_codon:yes gene_type:complete
VTSSWRRIFPRGTRAPPPLRCAKEEELLLLDVAIVIAVAALELEVE